MPRLRTQLSKEKSLQSFWPNKVKYRFLQVLIWTNLFFLWTWYRKRNHLFLLLFSRASAERGETRKRKKYLRPSSPLSPPPYNNDDNPRILSKKEKRKRGGRAEIDEGCQKYLRYGIPLSLWAVLEIFFTPHNISLKNMEGMQNKFISRKTCRNKTRYFLLNFLNNVNWTDQKTSSSIVKSVAIFSVSFSFSLWWHFFPCSSPPSPSIVMWAFSSPRFLRDPLTEEGRRGRRRLSPPKKKRRNAQPNNFISKHFAALKFIYFYV